MWKVADSGDEPIATELRQPGVAHDGIEPLTSAKAIVSCSGVGLDDRAVPLERPL